MRDWARLPGSDSQEMYALFVALLSPATVASVLHCASYAPVLPSVVGTAVDDTNARLFVIGLKVAVTERDWFIVTVQPRCEPLQAPLQPLKKKLLAFAG